MILILLSFLTISCIFYIIITKEQRINPLKRKQRIIELTNITNEKFYVIQQQNIVFKTWTNAYIFRSKWYGDEHTDLQFDTYNEAKNKLNELINEQKTNNLKQHNKKIINKKVVAITK